MEEPKQKEALKENMASLSLKANKRKKIIITISSIFGVLLVGTLSVFAYLKWFTKEEEKPEDKAENVPESYTPSTAHKNMFADYEEVKVEVTPQVPAYSVDAGLTNVDNYFTWLSDEAKGKLAENYFVVTPGYLKEFFQLYENNRYAYLPSFVTTDSVLHNYHLMFNHLLETVEKEKLITELQSLNTKVLAEAKANYEELKGTEWENASKRNVGFFVVGSKLLDPSIEIPEYVKTEVEAELAFIEAHNGIEVSPVMNIGADPNVIENLKEDYTQYIPRGHYDKTDELRKYFKSMMWYGRLTFRFKNEDEIKSAALITLTLNKAEIKKNWDTIYEPTNFFVGKSDDITFYQLLDVMNQVYGDNMSFDTLTTDTDKFASLVKSAKEMEPPQINSMPIFDETIQPDREAEIQGFRFMGQRFTIDASVFQRLVYREVKENPEGERRMLPKGLDIPAAMGSEEAYDILKSTEEDKYENYPENMTKMRDYISGLDTVTWTQNLYWGWMYSLNPLTEVKGEGYPMFMQNDAWLRHDLNTYLGSWTELKHDTILYSKQVYAELGAGGPPDEQDDRGYVEPEPYLYARIAALLKMTNTGLETRDLLSDSMKDNLYLMEELVMKLKTISEKELNNQSLTEEEYELIRTYGGQLEHLWNEINQEEMEEMDMPLNAYLNENPAALVTDVATDPNGQVLEEGVGNIYNIFVVVPVDGKLKVAHGGVFSHYEFPWVMSDRLTDKKWREMLDNGEAPDMDDWKNDFIVFD